MDNAESTYFWSIISGSCFTRTVLLLLFFTPNFLSSEPSYNIRRTEQYIIFSCRCKKSTFFSKEGYLKKNKEENKIPNKKGIYEELTYELHNLFCVAFGRTFHCYSDIAS